MRSFYTFLIGSLPLALGAPQAPVYDNFRVTWTHDKEASTVAVVAYNEDRSAILGQSCSDFNSTYALTDGNFAKTPLSFNVNENGMGELVYAGKTFRVHSVAARSGGISCSIIYGDDLAKVDCLVPKWEGPVIPEVTSPNEIEHCSVSGNEKRQTTCQVRNSVEVVGDGDPHQDIFHQQLSEVMSCESATNCVVGRSESKSFSVGWSASVQFTEWLSGGFDVQKTWETGNDYQCYGDQGQDVCVWYATAHTAYTVRTKQVAPCNDPMTSYGDPVVIRSPNKDNRGGRYYCVVGTCRAQGDSYWEYNNRAGGP